MTEGVTQGKRGRPLMELSEEQADIFRQDWCAMSVPELERKYGVSHTTLSIWGNRYECPQPKPTVKRKKISLADPTKTTPKQIMDSTSKIMQKNPGLKDHKKLDELSKQFNAIAQEKGKSRKERIEEQLDIVHKYIGEYSLICTTPQDVMDVMVSWEKLVLYERRVAQDDEEEQMDKATLINLKKRFVKEAFDDVRRILNETEARMFVALVKTARKRVLTLQRQKQEEQEQQQVADGVIEAEYTEP